MGKVLAAYGGGFKPPTKGHFEIVQKALNEFPEIDEFFIYVGGKERDGIDQFEAIQVWDIYKKYLANKIDIQPSKQPIKSVLDLAKENPQDIIYFILGYREGREDDTQDITDRSKLEEKYPNLIVKTLGTPDPNMSGTNARKSIADEEEFIKFLPDEVEEKSEIWNIIRPAVNEDDPKKGTGKKPEGSKRRLYTDEDPKDTVGIKFSTRQDIVDTLGKASFKAKSHARQSQIINLIHQRVRAAYGRAKDPKVKKRLKASLDYITKKKEASKKKTQRLKNQKENIAPNHDGKAAPFGSGYKPLNENATYSKKIDLINNLASLTQHMLDKGMNIEPLPKLEFIDGDVENASQFLGKTAYYDPNTQTIVLYTEGRHPKDITRSYAHEMIHHIQNLEGRLGNIQTTNTLEDDNLNNIEAEANLKGTMTFRNWTDSLTEGYKHKYGFNDKLGKDPFGLNQFAREIATEVEEVMNKEKISYKIFSDMDGVLTDFDESFLKYSEGIPPREYEKTYGKEKFWELIDGKGGVGFWVGMPWMEDGKQYWDYIKNYDTELLSSPSRSSTSRLGKRLWVRNNMPGVKLTLAQAAKKQNYAAPNHILIDDRPSNIDQWKSQGGIGILHTSAADTISQLKQLGL